MHYYCIWRRLKLSTRMKVFHQVYVYVIFHRELGWQYVRAGKQYRNVRDGYSTY